MATKGARGRGIDMFSNLPDIGLFIKVLLPFAALGLLALLGGAGWLIWWIVSHLAWV